VWVTRGNPLIYMHKGVIRDTKGPQMWRELPQSLLPRDPGQMGPIGNPLRGLGFPEGDPGSKHVSSAQQQQRFTQEL